MVWCKLLDLTSTLLRVMQPEDFAQIVCELQNLLAKNSDVEVRETAAQFLGKCGSQEIPEHLESAVLGNIATMFSSLVSDENWLVHQRAFQSVKAFAEVTRYTHIMGDCVPESLLPALSDFLNSLPYRHTEFTEETDFWKRFLKLKFEAAESGHNQYRYAETSHDKGIPLKDSGSRSCEKRAAECDPPEAKRLKLLKRSSRENQGEEAYEEAIKNMKMSLSTILDLRKQFAPPPRIIQQIEEIQRQLRGFVSSTPTN
ncbi:PREDICTED: uncharacterized protein LOC107346820 [Acropora digitifera]|uniref:uncharacterized protein LOC107346820 n=1 Tax=Acropora digitifera TaxID=70779 RepID=UPI00077B171D|nr:PREDICTED: uncharacterized protein LOC107346820 [Acropora digitifera]